MNYKKIATLLVATSALVLAGCGNSAKDMSFDDVYEAFWESHTSDAIEMFNEIADAPAVAEKGEYTISATVTGGIEVDLTVHASSVVDGDTLDTDSTITMTGSLVQAGLDDTISFNGGILFKMISGLSYLNLSSLSLVSDKGNPQISMIGAFSSVLTNKWISLASSGFDTPATLKSLNLSNLYSIPARLVESLQDNQIFIETSKEMIDGNPVYHVALDPSALAQVARDVLSYDAVQAFLEGQIFTDEELMDWATTFVNNAAFEGTLTAYDRDDIVLTIDKLRLDESEYVKGSIADETITLNIADDSVSPEVSVATLLVEEKGGKVVFSLLAPNQMLDVNGSFDLSSAGGDSFAYKLALVATHPEFSVNLLGDIDVTEIDAVSVEAPQSYQTIDDLV